MRCERCGREGQGGRYWPACRPIENDRETCVSSFRVCCHSAMGGLHLKGCTLGLAGWIRFDAAAFLHHVVTDEQPEAVE